MNITEFKRPILVQLVSTPVGYISSTYKLVVGQQYSAISEVGSCYVLDEDDDDGKEMVLLKSYFRPVECQPS